MTITANDAPNPLKDTTGLADEYAPEWWLTTLAKALQDRRYGRSGKRTYNRSLVRPCRVRPGLELLHDYLIGDPPLVGYAEGWGDHFRVISRLGRLNVAELIINAKSARMNLTGFRTAATDDDLGDERAAEVMRANNLAVTAREVHDFQLSAADGYTMVQPLQDDDEVPIITAEDPRQTITAHDSATGRTIAALKMFRDEWDSADIVHLYVRLANGKFRHFPLRQKGPTSLTVTYRDGSGYELIDDTADLERCPIIRFRNRGGRGEYERHLDSMDRINDQIMDKVVIAKVQAFRQMVIKGLPDKQVAVVNGAPVETAIDYSDAFIAEPGSLWRVPKDVDIWESQTTDLGPLRLAIKDDLQHLAAVTQTSLPAITPDAAQGSAEGAQLMREEEVFAVEACIDYANGGWRETMSTAFAFMGDKERAKLSAINPMWAPVERYGLSEKGSAASQAATSLPREAIWRDIWQYPPEKIKELRQMQGRDLFTSPAPTPPTPATPAVPAVTFQPPGATGGSSNAG